MLRLQRISFSTKNWRNDVNWASWRKYQFWRNLTRLAKFGICGNIFDEICTFWRTKNGIFGGKILCSLNMLVWRYRGVDWTGLSRLACYTGCRRRKGIEPQLLKCAANRRVITHDTTWRGMLSHSWLPAPHITLDVHLELVLHGVENVKNGRCVTVYSARCSCLYLFCSCVS